MRQTLKRTTWRILSVVALSGGLFLAGLAAGPCVEQRALENGLASFRVTVTEVRGVSGGAGTPREPYPYPEQDIELVFEAIALDQFSEPIPTFQGEVSLKVTPGEIVGPGTVEFRSGRAAGSVSVRKVFGRVALWLEDVVWLDGEPARNGADEVPQVKPVGTWASGVSNALSFANPSVRQVQYHPTWLTDNYGSVLPERFVEFDPRLVAGLEPGAPERLHGQLLVTGIFNDGFFVTDLADQGLGFNHLYAYSYSYPEDLDEGDRLDKLVGTSQDFSGCTQIGFPAWRRATDARLDSAPLRVRDIDALAPPAPITTAMCRDGAKAGDRHLCSYSRTSLVLEAHESGRVRLEDLHASDLFIDCDFNSDLSLPLISTENPAEYACRDACMKHDGKTELTVKRIRAKPETLWAISTEGQCASDADCLSGRCGGFTTADAQDRVCRVLCPWEAGIANIRPNCVRITVPPRFICSELSTMESFGQWAVALPPDPAANPPELHGPQISLITRETLVTYDPSAQENLGRAIPYLQGNLRQVRAARPRWLVLVGHGPNDVPPDLQE
jgi:hypothetical protein